MEDPELEAERAHATAAREGLRRMLDVARHQVVIGELAGADRYALESLGRLLRSNLKRLAEEPDGPPFFGRVDFASHDADHGGRAYHLGRRHVPGGPESPPLVLDWRAPVARVFYQASAKRPQGVAVRRRFGWDLSAPPVLTGFEDERLDVDGSTGDGRPGRLLEAEIERPRRGPMRDIVATIQPDQDELVRAALEESICVQGAPGTGKTAVGLHRAAFLLYSHRERLEKSGVLIVGPNPAFLAYISAVLPALGEADVEQATLAGLLERTRVQGEDAEAVAVVKHDQRMATVLHRLLYAGVGAPTETLVVPDGAYRWRVPAEELGVILEDVRKEKLPYEAGRERIRARVASSLRRRAERRGSAAGAAWLRKIGRSPAVTAFLDETWPRVKPEALVARLLGDRASLARAADGLLSDEEQDLIAWARPRSARSARWSAADAVLVDEAAGLIEPSRSMGHVIVDEAQDLSPMECRVIARRSGHGSLTVLGDLAQGTTPWAACDWDGQLAHLGVPGARVVPLTDGFRVPGAVLDLANRLLAALDVDVPPGRPVRGDGEVRVLPAGTVAQGVVDAVRDALTRDGAIGVIAAEGALAALGAALRAAGIEPGEAGGGHARVTLVPAGLAKGLEYDHVVVAEPAQIAEAEARGLNRLYVVLTRAVSRLDIVHARPLPAAITG
ncbi:HelD family protein [Actinomadura roseirufa]|uniref:HelD family protein n=1 Tax=Actinomadura roseirufa TaxID=2094049 RepID=UPI002795C978|nr:AAA family ATPase [Actinomadura roseirufa]